MVSGGSRRVVTSATIGRGRSRRLAMNGITPDASPAFDTGSGKGSPTRQGATRVTGIETTGQKKLMLFSGRAHPELAAAVATELGVELAPTQARDFANGE